MSWSFTNKTEIVMRETSKDRDVVIPVILPGYHQRGTYHAEVRCTVMVDDDSVNMVLTIEGDGGYPVETITRRYNARELNVQSTKRD